MLKRIAKDLISAIVYVGFAGLVLYAFCLPGCGPAQPMDDGGDPCPLGQKMDNAGNCVPSNVDGGNSQADLTAVDLTPTPDMTTTASLCAPIKADDSFLKLWYCHGPDAPEFSCDFILDSWGGKCYIICKGAFSCPLPPDLATASSFTCSPDGAHFTLSCRKGKAW